MPCSIDSAESHALLRCVDSDALFVQVRVWGVAGGAFDLINTLQVRRGGGRMHDAAAATLSS